MQWKAGMEGEDASVSSDRFTITLVAFTVATASMPTSRPSWSTASRVMKARTRCGPAWISTVALSASRLISVMTPGNRLRALPATMGR